MPWVGGSLRNFKRNKMTSNALLFDRAFIFGLTEGKTLSLKAGAWINRINYCLVCLCQLLHISESELADSSPYAIPGVKAKVEL